MSTFANPPDNVERYRLLAQIAAFEQTKRCACPYTRAWRPPATLTYRYDPFESPRRAVTIYQAPTDSFA